MESKVDTFRDEAVRGHDTLKELAAKNKDMLEARIDSFAAFGDEIQLLRDEIGKSKGMHDDYKRKML